MRGRALIGLAVAAATLGACSSGDDDETDATATTVAGVSTVAPTTTAAGGSPFTTVAGETTVPADPSQSTVVITAAPATPAVLTYTVVAGDGLFKIAESNCVTVEAIVAENGWEDGVAHTIHPGDVITIPGGGCNAPQTTVAPGTTVPASVPAEYTLPYVAPGRHAASSPECNAAFAEYDNVFSGPATDLTDAQAREWMVAAIAELRAALEPLAAEIDDIAAVLEVLSAHEPELAAAYVTFLRDTTNAAAYAAMAAEAEAVGLARYALAIGLTEACPPA